MKAFVIGSSTYIGQRLVATLEQGAWEVFVDNPDTLLQDLSMLKSRFDLVAHCDGVDGNSPKDFIRNSVLDACIFNWAVLTGQPRMLYLSSGDVYSEKLQDSDRWTTGQLMQACGGMMPPAPGVYRPYIRLEESLSSFHYTNSMPANNNGWNKMNGELLAQAAVSCGVKVHIVRLFGYYGEGLPNVHPFSRVKEAAIGRAEIPRDLTYISDWLHIADVIRGMIAIVQADEPGPVNICTGEGTNLEDLYLLMQSELLPEPGKRQEFAGDKSWAQVGDPTKFFEIYKPKVAFKTGVKRALRWK